MYSECMQRFGSCLKALPSVAALGHDEQGFRWYAECFQISRPDFGLARLTGGSCSADEDESASVPLTVESCGMVESGTEGARWPAIVLCGTKDQNSIGRSSLVIASLSFDRETQDE